MSSLGSLEEPDSRTSSVGRKRGFNQFATSDDNVILVGSVSSDEDAQHLGKRARYSGGVTVDRPVDGSSEASQDVIVVSDRLTPAHLLQVEQHVASPEYVPATSIGKSSASSALQPPTTWNQGTPVTIRTSFASGALPAELLSTELRIDAQMSANPEIDTATASNDNSKTISDNESSEELEINIATLTNKLPKITSNKGSEKETEKESAWSRVRARLPSPFGTAASQKQAEEIIQRLPEASRNLQPLEVGKTGLNFHQNGQVFKLPKTLYRGLPAPPLPLLSFRDPRFGFVVAFINENRSLSEFIDYGLLVKAFQEYLRQFYGHLPDGLTRLVGSSKQVMGKKSVHCCERFLNDVKTAQLEPKKINTKRRMESQILRPEQSNESPKNTESQPYGYGTAEKSKNPEPNPMARMLGMKRTQLPTITRVEDETKTLKESSDEHVLVHSQEFQPNDESGGVHIPEQSDNNQNPVDDVIGLYYPSSQRYSFVRRCLTCAQTDHETTECPYLTCVTCGLHGVHFTDGCPKTQRCSKCFGRGHQKSDCPEKLAATSYGDLLCDICKSSKHLESACHFLWRSFKPGFLETTRFVANIPIHCYCCGAEGHFGPECGLRRGPLYAEGYSWSKVNWRRYVDPESNNRALSAGKDYSLPVYTKSKKNFSIKGRAQNLDDKLSDENDDVAFIRKKVTKISHSFPKGNQRIKFETTRQQDDDYVPRPHLGPPVRDPRQQPLETYFEDRSEITYHPRDDSARHRRERSFTPPPRFGEERYLTRPGESYYPPGDSSGTYRPYEPRLSDFNGQARVPGARGNGKQRRIPGGLEQRGRPGQQGPRGKSQRGRKH